MTRPTSRQHRSETRTLADRHSGDLDTWQERLKGSKALVAILLPVAAVALGMTAFAIALHFAIHS